MKRQIKRFNRNRDRERERENLEGKIQTIEWFVVSSTCVLIERSALKEMK